MGSTGDVAISPQVYMGRCPKVKFKSLVTQGSESLAY